MDSFKKENVCEELKKYISKENIYIDEPMSKHTSIKVGGTADIFIKINTVEELINVINVATSEKEPITVLGNGTNILVKDKGIRGIVIRLCNSNYEFIDDSTIKVGAGMLNAKLSRILYEHSLSGFEFACGIPGTIGGAVRMNAGAYGSQLQDIVISTRYLDLQNDSKYSIKEISNEEHKFGYRTSIFNDKKRIIIDTTLKFTKSSQEEIQEKINENNRQRREKQPTDKPSAGSTFKRGDDFITSKLIDECGLKGFGVGGAQVSTKHAGFVVNTGNATAKDILELCDIIKKQVFEKFGKEICLEIEVLGE